MSERDERERQRMMAMLPDEGEVAGEIFAAMATVGEPGAVITRTWLLSRPKSLVLRPPHGGSRPGTRSTTAGWFAGSTSTSVATSVRTSHLGAGSTAQRFQTEMLILTQGPNWKIRYQCRAGFVKSPPSMQIPRR